MAYNGQREVMFQKMTRQNGSVQHYAFVKVENVIYFAKVPELYAVLKDEQRAYELILKAYGVRTNDAKY